MKRFLALVLLTSFLSIFSLGSKTQKPFSDIDFKLFTATNTINGVPITAETILGLSPAMPQAEREFIHAFLKMKPDVAAIMSAMEAFEGDNPVITQGNEGRAAYYRQTQQRLKAAGIKNLSRSSNTVFELNDFVLKGSSVANRHKNIGTGLFRLPYGAKIEPGQFEEFMAKCSGHTYQTISRVAYILRAQEARRIFNLDRCEFPEKYLVQIPGRPDTVADANYIVAERKVKHVVADLQEHPLALDPEIIRQLTILVGYTALWNHVGSTGNIFVVKDPETGELRICYHDTEQPNVHSPADFFHTTRAVHVSNVHHGWNGIKTEIIEAYAARLHSSIDETNLPDEQKELLKSLVDERIARLLKEKALLEEQIAAHLPQE